VGRESWTIVKRLGTETVDVELASRSAAIVVLLSFDFLVEHPNIKNKGSTIDIIFIFNSPFNT
jgi:hypothetical protein